MSLTVTLALFVFVLFNHAAFCRQSQLPNQQPPSASEARKSDYKALLNKAKAQDQSLDFTALRMAFADSAEYDPYGPDSDKRSEMFKALRGAQYDKAIEAADSILKKAFVNIDAHIACTIAYRETRKADRAEFHKWMASGLLKSILASGDGQTMETAFTVIAINEEYAILRELGLQMKSQALLHDKGHSYDSLTGVDRDTNKEVSLLFNIDKPMAWMAGRLGGKSDK